jgi:hypothetical protein
MSRRPGVTSWFSAHSLMDKSGQVIADSVNQPDARRVTLIGLEILFGPLLVKTLAPSFSERRWLLATE